MSGSPALSPTRSALKRRNVELELQVNDLQADKRQLRAQAERLRSQLQRTVSSCQAVLSEPEATAPSKWTLQMITGPRLVVPGLQSNEVDSTSATVVVYRAVSSSTSSMLFMPRDALVLLGVKDTYSREKGDRAGKLAKKVGNSLQRTSNARQDADVFHALIASAGNQKVTGIKQRGFGGNSGHTYFVSQEGMVQLCCKLLHEFNGYEDGAFLAVLEDNDHTAAATATVPAAATATATVALPGAAAATSDEVMGSADPDKDDVLQQFVSKHLAWVTAEDASNVVEPSSWPKPIYCK